MSYGVGGTGVVPEAGTFVAPVPGTRIYLKRSEIKGKQPGYDDAEYGELFVNYHSEDPMLCFKDNGGNIVALKPAGPIGNGPIPPGTNNEIGDLWWDGDNLLVWNGSSWEVVGEQALGDLTDVDTTGAADGMVLAYDGAEWVPVSPASLAVDVDLDYTPASDKGTVTNTAGDDATIPLANGTNAGLSLNNYTTAEKDKLAGVEDGAEANVVTSVHGRTGDVVAAEGDYSLGQMSDVDTAGASDGKLLKYQGGNWVAGSPAAVSVDLGYTPAADKGTVTNDAGTDAEIPFATSAQAGLFQEAPTPDSGSVQYARVVDDAGDATWAEINIPPGTIVDDGTGLPDDLADGQLWFNTTDNTLYVYLEDTDEWKVAVPGATTYWELDGNDLKPKEDTYNVVVNGDITSNSDIVAVGDIQSASQNGGQLAGFRNQLINGEFRFQQRSPFAGIDILDGSAEYYSDRWMLIPWGTDITTGLSESASGLTQTITPATTGAGIFCYFVQAIELPPLFTKVDEAPFLNGSTWTLSGFSPNKLPTNVELTWSTGAIARGVEATTEGIVVPTDRGKYFWSATFTIDTTNFVDTSHTCLTARILFNNLDGNRSLGLAQLEPGPIATPLERRPIGTELALCQRYYQKLGRLSGTLGTAVDPLSFQVSTVVPQMRSSSATITIGSQTGVDTFSNGPYLIGANTLYADGLRLGSSSGVILNDIAIDTEL